MIYVVRKGEPLGLIARQFGVSPEEIIEENELRFISYPVPGQSVIIPEGELSKQHVYRNIHTNGYIIPSSINSDFYILEDGREVLTWACPLTCFSAGDEGDSYDKNIALRSKEIKISPMLYVSNGKENQFDGNMVHDILINPDRQAKIIENILNILKNNGYYGINIHFERVFQEDREALSSFFKRLYYSLKREGYYLFISLPPKQFDTDSGQWFGAFDYEEIGRNSDAVIIMPGEWGWHEGPPMSLLPMEKLKNVIEYAVSLINSNKIMISMPLYGYDWIMPYCPGGPPARRITTYQAFMIAAKYHSEILYDEKNQSPYFDYSDDKNSHRVWFEDLRSFEVKLKLIWEYSLKGLSFIFFEKVYTPFFKVLNDIFKVQKIV
ncbi:glycosyl hydrolase family 18 protein [Fonticella tunisiensis]|uniref:Spore germination protein n=1 Tax=Fonticella tunisiensis TaxID=1096341 RepID=A0A4R7KUA2_9CLOT|nr:glycosyl hydrolase family 18 protein [Fonticella tunisiensis]TDT63294.1 spore germination protein [Fonticella tunisiensis]